MNKSIILATLFSVIIGIQSYAEETIKFSSSNQKIQLIELYSSQGCSSCPPAEKWLNEFTDDERLWSEVIPLGFHVDYWDRLGWVDPFGSKQYTLRQYAHRKEGNVGSVYTPGFVVNGSEWRGWFKGSSLPENGGKTGVLSVELSGGKLKADYSQNISKLEFNYAILGFNLVTEVTRGENSGRTLKHDFVVLKHIKEVSSNGKWTTELPDIYSLANTDRFGIAVWINNPGKLKPLQATGSWLKTVKTVKN